MLAHLLDHLDQKIMAAQKQNKVTERYAPTCMFDPTMYAYSKTVPIDLLIL